MRAQDVLPDDVNDLEASGIVARKGSVGAFLANARLLSRTPQDAPEHEAILMDIRELVPALRAIGLFDVLEVRNASLRALVEAS